MKGIILIDGPDAAGKTTLAKKICEKTETAEYVHLGKPNKGQAWAEHKAALVNAINSMKKGKLVVIDRHFLSEAVYGSVYREGSEYAYAARHVDRLLYRFGALRVICAPPVDYVLETHKKMIQEREEMYHDKMYEVAKKYIEIWDGLDFVKDPEEYARKGYMETLAITGGVSDKIGWYKYDVTIDGKNMDSYVEFLKYELNSIKSLLPNEFFSDSENFTGWPRRHSVLLVGDQASGEDGAWPFMSNRGSSLYLAKILNNLQVDEARLCMMNINGPGGPIMLQTAKILCGRIIAMGRKAEQLLEQQKIFYHARVRHPQHARRFTTHDNTYEDELREAFAGHAGVKLT